MDTPVLADKQKSIFIIFVWTLDAFWRTYKSYGPSGRIVRELRESVLPAQLTAPVDAAANDNDDNTDLPAYKARELSLANCLPTDQREDGLVWFDLVWFLCLMAFQLLWFN